MLLTYTPSIPTSTKVIFLKCRSKHASLFPKSLLWFLNQLFSHSAASHSLHRPSGCGLSRSRALVLIGAEINYWEPAIIVRNINYALLTVIVSFCLKKAHGTWEFTWKCSPSFPFGAACYHGKMNNFVAGTRARPWRCQTFHITSSLKTPVLLYHKVI